MYPTKIVARVEPLCGPWSTWNERAPGLDLAEAADRLRLPHRRVQVGRGAECRPDAEEPGVAGGEGRRRAGREEAGRRGAEWLAGELALARRREEERVVDRVGQVDRRPSREQERVERELRATLRLDEHPPLDAVGGLQRARVLRALHACHPQSIGSAATSHGKEAPCR